MTSVLFRFHQESEQRRGHRCPECLLVFLSLPTGLTVSLSNDLKPSDCKREVVNCRLCTHTHTHTHCLQNELCPCQTLSIFISNAPQVYQKISLIWSKILSATSLPLQETQNTTKNLSTPHQFSLLLPAMSQRPGEKGAAGEEFWPMTFPEVLIFLAKPPGLSEPVSRAPGRLTSGKARTGPAYWGGRWKPEG